MLKKEQWQWLADHHRKVRNYCVLGIILVFALYVVMIGKMMLVDVGKTDNPIPFTPKTNFSEKFHCDKIDQFDMRSKGGNTRPKDGYYEDANGLLLEWHKTFMYDERLLFDTPECIGAGMADSSNSPNHFVIIIYDTKTHKPIYRIARIDDVVKK